MTNKTKISVDQTAIAQELKLVKNAAEQLTLVRREFDSLDHTFNQYTIEELDKYIQFTTGFSNVLKASELIDLQYVKIKQKLAEIAPYRHLLSFKDGKYSVMKKAEKNVTEKHTRYLHPAKEAAKEKLEQIAALMNEVPATLLGSVVKQNGKYEVSTYKLSLAPLRSF